MSRLYIFADDSMMGRDDGGPIGAAKASTYIERELRRMRVTPAGDNGTYFQDIGYRSVLADTRSAITVDGHRSHSAATSCPLRGWAHVQCAIKRT
jgi:hypothetical protein